MGCVYKIRFIIYLIILINNSLNVCSDNENDWRPITKPTVAPATEPPIIKPEPLVQNNGNFYSQKIFGSNFRHRTRKPFRQFSGTRINKYNRPASSSNLNIPKSTRQNSGNTQYRSKIGQINGYSSDDTRQRRVRTRNRFLPTHSKGRIGTGFSSWGGSLRNHAGTRGSSLSRLDLSDYSDYLDEKSEEGTLEAALNTLWSHK